LSKEKKAPLDKTFLCIKMKPSMKLGVNIDHVATLRQARRETFPDPVEAAKLALKGGADSIVAHLREDRRHIQDSDIFKIRSISPRFDLEMAAVNEMTEIALRVRPDYVTLVPEKRLEITTEGGLDVKSKMKNLSADRQDNKSKMKLMIDKLQRKGIKVSLFIDPEPEQILASAKSGAQIIEIHTGQFARLFQKDNKNKMEKAFEKITKLTAYANELGLVVNAGHGLDYQNISKIVKIPGIEELNIGFSIISRAIFVGIKQAVEEMKTCISSV
jgi:pyridoxine 5-phosphate synthase